MIKNLRGAWLIMRIAFSADPFRSIAVIFLQAGQAASGPMMVLWLKVLIDGVVDGRSDRILLAAAGYGITLLILGISSYTAFKLSTVLSEKTSFAIDQRVIQLTSDLPSLEHHERADYQNELQLLRAQREGLAGTVQALVYNFSNLVSLTLTVLLLANVHRVLLLLFLFAIPSLASSGWQVSIGQKAMEKTVERGRLSRHLYELGTTVAPAKEIRIFGLGDEISKRHSAEWRVVDKESNWASLKGGAVSSLGWLIFALGYVGAIYVVARPALDGKQINPGDIVLVMGLASQLNSQLSQTVYMFAWLLQTLKTIGRFVWLVDYAKKAIPKIKDPIPAPDAIKQGIRLEGVSFSYPGTEREVLGEVNLTIPAGSTVAIVGENGAGKTTLVKLLCRFYEPTTGQITVDGVPLASMSFEEWRSRLSGGFQDFAKFEFIAREVVGIGQLANLEDVASVEAALERASATDVAPDLPKGLETQLGKSFEDGEELSVGQWQKLALGRAMMRELPLLLVLDEPTASLDAQTEHALFERYSGAARRVAAANGAITILVSHRFSTVRMADLIIVVDGGRITEVGTHDQLVASGGLYAELFELQARSYR
ncbi:MAG TPA: ABC transporter ATP-binding protein [Actinomycetota bacterium]|nr:ABC transporter ATP-binding protein [Actinomycetota bacterium]